MCQTYGLRPSSVLGIDDEWLAYDFDMAVSTLGLTVQSRLDETDKDGKRKNDIYKALNIPKPLPKVNVSAWRGIANVIIKD